MPAAGSRRGAPTRFSVSEVPAPGAATVAAPFLHPSDGRAAAIDKSRGVCNHEPLRKKQNRKSQILCGAPRV